MHRCTDISSAVCTDAQIFLSIHQEKGNYDVEAGDPPAFRYSGSRLISVEQSTQQPMHNMDLIKQNVCAIKYNIVVDPIPVEQDREPHFLYWSRTEPIKQVHVPPARIYKPGQTGNGNQISTISTLRYDAAIVPSSLWPPFFYAINSKAPQN